MIISSLCEYYSYMKKRGIVTPEGYSKIDVNYLICLTYDGKIDDIISLACGEGKEKTYPTKLFPERTQKSAIESNIVEHRPLYIFGLSSDKDTFTAEDKKAKKSHEAFVKANLEFFSDLTSPLCVAYRKFIENWNPAEETNNRHLLDIIKSYGTSRFAFCLTGRVNDMLQDDAQLTEKWDKIFAEKSNKKTEVAACPVYGEKLSVAPLHNKIKGVIGGQASGCILVCFNNPSENSYGKEQAYNSGISERAMKEYTEALNYLLSDKTHNTRLDDMTIVHFALSDNEEQYEKFVADNIFSSFRESKQTDIDDVDKGLKESMTKATLGQSPDFEAYNDLDDSTKYCIFGLVPNSSRLAVRFSYVNSFGHFKSMYKKYYEDYMLEGMKKIPPIWCIKKELISPQLRGSESLPPEYNEKLLRTVLDGTPLPYCIAERLIRRIKTDSDTERDHFIKMNETRIGLLKVYLNRKNINGKEKIIMSLNKENVNPAYLCGRLFAVLEKVQQDASGTTLNKTIKDSYFSSACSTPALVFPRLMKLSNAHISKLQDNAAIFYRKLMGEIIDCIEEFPKNLSLTEQGNFIVGYYQQNKDLYTKKDNKTEEN